MKQSEAEAVVALETTLLVHGVPGGEGWALASRLKAVVERHGARAAVVGVVKGKGVAGLSDEQLREMLAEARKNPAAVLKVNTANLGLALHRNQYAATTVATTMEIAAKAGISVMATGGLGGVHRRANSPPPPPPPPPFPRGCGLDVSADLIALTRFPVCVVCSGAKSILDVAATREVLETLGVPVVGFGTDVFPCFYLRRDPDGITKKCDGRFDDVKDLAKFVRHELARTNRGVVVCNPIAHEHEIAAENWKKWIEAAELRVTPTADLNGSGGRDVTPRILAALHELSGGATLRANVELAAANAELAARLAVEMAVPGN